VEILIALIGRLLGWRPRRCLRVPLQMHWSTTLHTPHVHVDVPLWIQPPSGARIPIWFRADSGATVTRLPVQEAQSLRLALPGPRLTWAERTAAGSVVVQGYVGHLDVWLTRNDEGPPFRIPVHFPDLPGDLNLLLGLGGVVDQLRWVIDGSYQHDAPFGVFLLQELRRR